MQKKILISLFGASVMLLGCPAEDDGGSATSAASGSDNDEDEDEDEEETEGDEDDSDGSDSDDSDSDDSESDSDDSDSDPSESDSDSDPSESDSDSDPTDSDSDSDSDTDDSASESGIGFIEDPDGGGVSIECSVWDQDCMEGQKCAPWANDGGNAWNATKCVPVNPTPDQPGDSCTVEGSGVSGLDSCDVSSMCWDVDGETNMGTCVAFCTGSETTPLCDNPMTSCSIANEGVLILCLPNCDALLQDCPEGQACYPIDDAFVCAPDASGEMGADDDPCEFINACDAGLGCFNAAVQNGCNGASGCCTPFCDLDGADPCMAPEMCTPLFDMGNAPPGLENIGFCGIEA